MFDLANLGDLDKPLTAKILSDPYNKITRHILYLYSMESFIYADLNRASREKDKTKIKFYGAYAAALSYIIYFANTNRKDEKLKGFNQLYRGLKMKKSQLDVYKPGSTIHLMGYTSTSLDPQVACNFALEELTEEKVPVIF